MKGFYLALLIVHFTTTGRSQDSSITLSRFEAFVAQPEINIKVVAAPLSELSFYKLSKLVATDLASGRRSTALKLQSKRENFILPLVEAKGIYIDSAEVNIVIHTLEGFLSETEKEAPMHEVIFRYRTGSDLQLSCYYEKLYEGRWVFEIDKVYQKIHSSIPGTQFSFNKKRMKEFLGVLKLAQASM